MLLGPCLVCPAFGIRMAALLIPVLKRRLLRPEISAGGPAEASAGGPPAEILNIRY